jgi:hypothetical protein
MIFWGHGLTMALELFQKRPAKTKKQNQCFSQGAAAPGPASEYAGSGAPARI